MGVEMTRASPVLPTAFYETVTLHQRGGGATSRFRAYGDRLTATGAESWKEVKWVWEAKGGFSWSTGDAHEWPSKAVPPPPATPRPSALMNVLNSGITPRGPWPRH